MTSSPRRLSVARLVEPLGSRDFRLTWIAQLITLIGVQGYIIAQTWLVIERTSSTATLGTLITLFIAPRALLLPIGGMLSDRWHPRRLLLASIVGFAGIAIALFRDVAAGDLAIWHLMVHAVLFGIISGLCLPAFFAILPMLVEDSRLQSANSLTQITMQASQFVGPALGGIVIHAVGIERSYAVMAAVFATAAALISLVRGRDQARDTGRREARVSTRLEECLSLFRRDRRLLGLVLLTMLTNLGLAGPLQVALPSLAHGSLRTGVDGLGWLLSAFGAGTLAGSLVAGSLNQLVNRMHIALAAGAVAGINWAVLGANTSLVIAFAMLAIVGVCLGVLNVLFITQVQSLTPAHLVGRVMGIQLFGSVGLQPISFLLAGWAIDRIGPLAIFLVGGLLITFTCLALMPSWKRPLCLAHD
jgi:MFS transporter, DHA3 family, macrolide efflux protein